MEFQSTGPDITAAWGQSLGRVAQSGLVLGLVGDLGAGKTLFVQGLARGLGVPPGVRVVSPTFTLINEVRGGRLPLIHADLYRIESEAELAQIGLEEMVGGPGVVAIEWADRLDVLGRDWLELRISVAGDRERRLVATAQGRIGSTVLAAWAAGGSDSTT